MTLRKHKLLVGACASIGLFVGGSFALARGGALWPSAGQNLNNTRHQANEVRIGPKNAAQLTPKWVFQTGGDVWTTPAVDEDFVYVPDAAGNLFKIDRETGVQVWSHKIEEYTGVASDLARATPALAGGKLILGDQGGRQGAGARVFAVDQRTGALLWATKVDEHPVAVVTQSAVVHGNRVYVGVSSNEEFTAAVVPGYPCCSFRGSILALDLKTGAILWKTYTVPNLPEYSGGAVWGSTPVVDAKRQSLYITTGNNYTVPQAILDCATLTDSDAVRQCVAAVPGAADNHFDAVVALDLTSGAIRWARTMIPFDSWNVSCIFSVQGNEGNCTDPAGPDYDFGQGAMLFKVRPQRHGPSELLGAGQKSGMFWALDPQDGRIVWNTQVGPGGTLGGLQWGSATDGRRIYAAISNNGQVPWTLPSGQVITSGFWSALDPASGAILWQTPGNPAVSTTNQSPVSVANGVVFGGTVDEAGTMYALEAATGKTLWTFASGGSVVAGAAIADGVVYWGSGYAVDSIGLTGNNKLYAFGLPDNCPSSAPVTD
jgi:polyvinyl alcohol dehydrogenase (cytochrome)